jgi:hypothetical protein
MTSNHLNSKFHSNQFNRIKTKETINILEILMNNLLKIIITKNKNKMYHLQITKIVNNNMNKQMI